MLGKNKIIIICKMTKACEGNFLNETDFSIFFFLFCFYFYFILFFFCYCCCCYKCKFFTFETTEFKSLTTNASPPPPTLPLAFCMISRKIVSYNRHVESYVIACRHFYVKRREELRFVQCLTQPVWQLKTIRWANYIVVFRRVLLNWLRF